MQWEIILLSFATMHGSLKIIKWRHLWHVVIANWDVIKTKQIQCFQSWFIALCSIVIQFVRYGLMLTTATPRQDSKGKRKEIISISWQKYLRSLARENTQDTSFIRIEQVQTFKEQSLNLHESWWVLIPSKSLLASYAYWVWNRLPISNGTRIFGAMAKDVRKMIASLHRPRKWLTPADKSQIKNGVFLPYIGYGCPNLTLQPRQSSKALKQLCWWWIILHLAALIP